MGLFERSGNSERTLLVHIDFRHGVEQADLDELNELALAAGAYPVARITSVRDKPDPKFYIGKGKLQEILQAIATYQAQLVIFNHDLSAAQERNIEREINCRVLSRTGVILDIFAQRARTFEGKLQVELAQLEHMSTRLVKGWSHLERQKGGIGLRGPGETQLESDRRLLKERMVIIRKRLEKVRQQRQQSRSARARAAVPTIALVGYTNAGKSTLFNALTGAQVGVANQLFATLDPTLRAIEVAGVGKVVLADTVGFIRQLPHSLIDAFRATLEETCQAVLLLHVVDAQDKHAQENIHQVNQVLSEIGASHIPQLMVFNKADRLVNAPHQLGDSETDQAGVITQIWVSALTHVGLGLLRQAMASKLSVDRVEGILYLSPTQAPLRAHLYALQAVIQEKITEQGGWELIIKTPKYQWEKLCHEYPALSLLPIKRG